MDQAVQAILNAIVQAILNVNNSVQITDLVQLIGFTPPGLSFANPIIGTLQALMVGAADAFLGLYLLIAIYQHLYGEYTGKPGMPLPQLVGRLVLTVILIHLSGLLGQDLVILNNVLCGLVQANVAAFAQQVHGGQAPTDQQQLVLAAVLSIVFNVGLLRVVYQAVKRVVFFNLLYVLSGPAFLLSFHPPAAPYFSFWSRTIITTAFSQILQLLTLSLGIQFVIASKQGGPLGYLVAAVAVNLTAEIPGLLARFAASAPASVQGVGAIARNGALAAQLLA